MSLNHSIPRRRRIRQVSAGSESCETRSLLSASPMTVPEAELDSPEIPPELLVHPPSFDPSQPGVFSDCVTLTLEGADIGPSEELLAVTYLVDEPQPGTDIEFESISPPVDQWDPSWIYYASIFESGPVPGDPSDVAPGEFDPAIESPIEFHGGPTMTTPPDVFPTTMESPDGSGPGSFSPGIDERPFPEGWHPLMELVRSGPGFDPESLELPPEGFLIPDLCQGPEDSPSPQMNPEEANFDPESKPDAIPDLEASPEYYAVKFFDTEQPIKNSSGITVDQMWEAEPLPDDSVQPYDDSQAPSDGPHTEIFELTSVPEEAELPFAELDDSDISPRSGNVDLPNAVPISWFTRSIPDLGEELSQNNTQTIVTVNDALKIDTSDEHRAVLSSKISITSDIEADVPVQSITVNPILTVSQWIPQRMNSLFHTASTPTRSGLTEPGTSQQSRGRGSETTEGSDRNPMRSGRSTTSSASQRSVALRKLSVTPLSDILTDTQLNNGQQSEGLPETTEQQSQQRKDSASSQSQPVTSDNVTGPKPGDASPVDVSSSDRSLSRQRIAPSPTQQQIDHFMSQFAQDSFVG